LYNHLSHICFKIAPLCKYVQYVQFPATAKVLETLLETVLWKSFELVSRVLNDRSIILKASFLQCRFHSMEQVKITWGQVRKVWGRGCSSVVTLFFANKSLTKTDHCAGALSWRRIQLLVLHFCGHFLLTASLRQRRMSMYIYLFTVVIPVNYTSEFRELSEAAMYIHKIGSLRIV
jgi:hypothetical protein